MKPYTVAILTPHGDKNAITHGYAKSIRLLERRLSQQAWKIDDNELGFVELEIDSTLTAASDVIRTRSRLARQFVLSTNADFALWVDDDIDFSDDLSVVPRMVALAVRFSLGVVGAPYPRKMLRESAITNAVLWATKAIKESDNEEERKRAHDILLHPLRYAYTQQDFVWYLDLKREKPPQPPHAWLTGVDGVGFGCCLTSRNCLFEMLEHYGKPGRDGFDDKRLGGITTALFYPQLEDEQLPSEDYAFCRRWQKLGHQVFAYTGPGAPVKHIGSVEFNADRTCMLRE